MVGFLYVMGLLAFGYAALVLLVGKTSIHEIQAGIGFLLSAVLIGSGAVCDAVDRLRRAVTDRASAKKD